MPVKIISLNVDSLVHHCRRTQLLDFIAGSGAEVYLLQETELDDTIRLNIPGYNIFRNDIDRGWGGVALVVRDNVPVRKLRRINAPIQSISIEIHCNDRWESIGSVYVPHRLTDPRSAFDQLLGDRTGANTIFGGDFNARHTYYGDSITNQ